MQGRKVLSPGKNRSNMDETSRKKGGKGEKKGCSRITVLLKWSWMNRSIASLKDMVIFRLRQPGEEDP